MEEYFYDIELEQPDPHEIERERARSLEHKARRNLSPISGPDMLNIAMAAARDALGPEKSLTLGDIMEYGTPALMRLHRQNAKALT